MDEGFTPVENVFYGVVNGVMGNQGFIETMAITGLVITLIFAGWTLAKNSLKKSTN